jgi:hypothetical protein
MKIIITGFLILSAFGSIFSQSSRGGSLFYEQIRTLDFIEREKAIVNEIKSGNFPLFLNSWEELRYTGKDAKGKRHRVILFVKADYLAAGTDEDYFTLPMSPQSAQEIANHFNASLPTPKIVDLIYSKSRLKLEPFNFIPRGNRNETPDILYDHSKIITAQIKASGNRPGVFVAGTKKDIVISSKLSDSKRTHHVTIYGWHKTDGTPIQPVTNIHIDVYVDYSHGVRLVSNRVLIDGKEYNYRDVLQDSVLHTLLNWEREPLRTVSYNIKEVSEKR